ncbi:hypothetical protein KZX06_05605 [Micrococcus sp. EYE_162]|uniref:hypothetical protein n=1 Tax=Micrococcus TaxID=1269 RepID=UPI002003E5DB|nr:MULTISPECIES: hypothetical protein [unclassified Micrococcus]MCK6095439.1 hypothetical protein [Micrococcus sp. EYE_212]MCK6171514.1 hypothetical protein [Micrococcus sp. EYE_162]
MILARIPRRRDDRAAAPRPVRLAAGRRAAVAPDSGRVRPVSPLGPAMVLALGGVALSAVRRMRARAGRRRAAGTDRA